MHDVRICLKGEIDRRGFAQATLARKANLTPQQLSDVLNMRRRLEANEMIALCAAMEIDISALMRPQPTPADRPA